MNCLYCGKRLGWVCNTEYKVDPSKPPNVSWQRPAHSYGSGGKDSFKCTSNRFDGEGRRVEMPHRGAAVRVHMAAGFWSAGGTATISPARTATGFSARRAHGWKFGRLAGEVGYRLNRTKSRRPHSPPP